MTERFTLLSELGRGGMGVVWKARDEETGQTVALKLLRETYAEDPDYVTRFERELELAKRIHSANVVQVLGYGVREGTPYLALEYVDGPSLRERLASHGPYGWPETKALLAQIAGGLADAHAAGVVHRDLKPSNILIGSDGVAKIADFGIAKGLDLTRGVTGTSTLLGTPAYLPPEGPADERSDLYSLGVIAYELLTGVVPFEGRTYQEVILRHVRDAPDLERLPKDARKTIGWLLAKNPAKRPQTAWELVAALEGGQRASGANAERSTSSEPIPGTPEAIATPLLRRSRTRRRASVAIAAAVALVLAFGAGVTVLAVLPPGSSAVQSSRVALAAGLDATGSPRASGSGGITATVSAGPSPSVGSNPSPSSGPSASLRVSPGPTALTTPGSTATLKPEPTALAAVTPAPTSTPTPTPTPVSSAIATVTPSPLPQPTASPMASPQPSVGGAYITGVVTASEGGPLAGIDIYVCPGAGGSCSSSKSASDGSYAVGPVTPASYSVFFQYSSAGSKNNRVSVYYTPHGASIWDLPEPQIDVGSSGASGIDVTVPLGYSISGTLTPATGKSPPHDAGLVLFSTQGTGELGSGDWRNVTTYSTQPIPPGSYIVAFWNENNSSQWVYWSSSGLTSDRNSATPVTISSSSISGIDGQLPW